MKSKNPTIKHILNPEFNDAADEFGRGIILNKTPYKREIWQLQGGWQRIAEFVVDEADSEVVWFPDSNVSIRPDASVFWDAARTAHSRTFQRQVVLTAPIWSELREWLEEPFRMKELAAEISRCLDKQTGFVSFVTGATLSDEMKRIADYYICLVSLRRNLAIAAPAGKTLEGVPADDKSLALSKVAERHGERGLMFAQAGRKDLDSVGHINVNDEAHVVISFLHAILNKTSVAILTTDRHAFDIFNKLQWFIDTHYRSWLVGQKIATGFYGCPEFIENERSLAFFDGPCEVYPKKSFGFDELMTMRDHYFAIEVFHVEHDGTINVQKVVLEDEVADMLVSKSQNGGLNSSVFSPRNVHIDMAPINEQFGGYIGIASDKRIQEPSLELTISMIDADHAIHSFERSASQSGLST